jgi:hypothetical protein
VRRYTMASLYKKLIIMGVSTILIPLGKLAIKKIMQGVNEKPDSRSSDEEKVKLISNA